MRTRDEEEGAMLRRGGRALLGALLLVVVIQSPVSAAPPLPHSMAGTGDSISRAYNTGFWPFTDNPAGSWSTGTIASVNSHYLRIRALNPAIQGKAYNDARSGALMRDLNGQMATVVAQRVDYVTVLMGGNDVCQPTEAQMTDAVLFESQFKAAMDTLTAGSPGTRVFVLTIPNVYNLWAVLKNVCGLYTQCRFDNHAVFNTAFTASDVSTRDYFHPSVAGQAKLAAGTWAVGFWP